MDVCFCVSVRLFVCLSVCLFFSVDVCLCSLERFYCTVGCHPTRCNDFEKADGGAEQYLEDLHALIREGGDKVVSLGELGLGKLCYVCARQCVCVCVCVCVHACELLCLLLFAWNGKVPSKSPWRRKFETKKLWQL